MRWGGRLRTELGSSFMGSDMKQAINKDETKTTLGKIKG